jgi:hypothetical protein
MSETKEVQLTSNQGALSISADPEVIKQFRINLENFTARLNKSPKKEKIQKHQGYEYLPISVVEKELDKNFFGLVQYECISYSQIFNEIACHARIKVFHPVIMQWVNYDGLGSAVIQQDANTKVYDFNQFKKPNALQLTLPKAYAEAIKNAAKKIGKLFGADINRKFEDVYEPLIGKEKKTPEQVHEDRMSKLIQDCTSIDDLAKLRKDTPESLYELLDDKFTQLKEAINND